MKRTVVLSTTPAKVDARSRGKSFRPCKPNQRPGFHLRDTQSSLPTWIDRGKRWRRTSCRESHSPSCREESNEGRESDTRVQQGGRAAPGGRCLASSTGFCASDSRH